MNATAPNGLLVDASYHRDEAWLTRLAELTECIGPRQAAIAMVGDLPAMPIDAAIEALVVPAPPAPLPRLITVHLEPSHRHVVETPAPIPVTCSRTGLAGVVHRAFEWRP